MRFRLPFFRFRRSEGVKQSVQQSEGDTRWIDGLRGLSSLFVICNHVALAVAPILIHSISEEARVQSISQWPFIQIFTTGFPWVAFFLVLSAWVNSIKPLKSLQQDQYDEAILSLSSSCFRRVLRLVAPITVATIFSWFLAQFGAYQLGYNNVSEWLRSTSPRPSGSIGDALWALWYSFYQTWTEATNYYDRNLWCMAWFLRSSMLLYLFLLATCRIRTKIRVMILFSLLFWAWRTNDDLVGTPTYIGILLATLAANPKFREFSTSRSILRRFLSFSLFITGWFFMSFPSHEWDHAPWFRFLTRTLVGLFPKAANIFNHSIYIGLVMVLTSILLSSTLQNFLRHPILLWLGDLSLPIYLIHGPLLRSFYLWIVYAFVKYPVYYEEMDEYGHIRTKLMPLGQASTTRILIGLPFLLFTTIYLATIWNRTIEPMCASFARKVEDHCMVKRDVLIRFKHVEEKTETIE